jgi:protease PrsW
MIMIQPDRPEFALQSELDISGSRPSSPSGLAQTLATRLNCILQPRGVRAKVVFQEGCLKILLSSTRSLDQKTFVRFIQRQFRDSEIEVITSVKVYGQQIGDEIPSWYQEFVPLPASALENGAIASFQGQVRSGSASSKPDYVFLKTLRTFQLSAVFPYQDVVSGELYNTPIVRLLLFFGLFPLIVDLVADRTSLAQIAWLIGIYYASIWGVVLYDLIKPAQFSWRTTLKCVLFTTFVGIPTLLLVQHVPPFKMLYEAIGAGWLPRVVGFILGVGVLEEVCKALPVYLFLLRTQKLHDPLTSAFYGAMSGLGFAIAEGATYSLIYGFGLRQGDLEPGSYIIVNTIRFVSLPLFHAILAGMVGYFIGLAAINPSRQGAILFIGLAIAATLHGLYDSFAGSVFGLMIIGFSILLFVTYLRRSQQMVDEMQKAELSHRSIS